jgi:hypothetical protein
MTIWLALIGCDLFESAIPGVAIDVDLVENPSDAAPSTVQPWEIPVSVDVATPFVSAPGTQQIGPLLLLDSMAREGGEDQLLSLTADDLTASGAPFVLQVMLGGGAVMSLEPGAVEAVPPAACQIDVDPGNLDASAHAADLLACFRAFVDTNGAPTNPTVSFAIGSRADGISYSATLRLEADENLELGCAFDSVLPSDVTSNPDKYKLEDLRIGGYVGAVDHGALTWGFVIVYDDNDVVASSASSAIPLSAGDASYIGDTIAVSDPAASGLTVASQPAIPDYLPADDWNAATGGAMLGVDGAAPGSADACWGSLHDDVPNRVIVSWALLGEAAPQL